MLKKILSVLLFVSSLSAFAQDETVKNDCPETENGKAKRLYEKALDRKKYKDKKERVGFLEEAIKLDENYADAYWRLAKEIMVVLRLDNKPYTSIKPYMKRAVELCPQVSSEPYYYLGYEAYEMKKNDSAVYWLEKFLAFKYDPEADNKFAKPDEYTWQLDQAKSMIAFAKKETELKNKVVPFSPKLVTGISTEVDEFLPYLSPDGTTFLYTRRLFTKSKNQTWATDKETEFFCQSKLQANGTFDQGGPLPEPFNQNPNEGGASLTIDNKHLFYTQSRFEGGAQMNTDIYYTDLYDGSWGEIKKVPNINDPVYWDSQPSVSADGMRMYFASDRPGGYGKSDIYFSVKDPVTKQWSKPKNCGPTINTHGDEKCPFIHSDSETLYFCSDGWFGYGDLDNFYTKRNEKGEWMKPENLGYPINTAEADAGFIVSQDGKTAYFCSYNEGKMQGKGVGKYDLYSFELYEKARPQEVHFFKGKIEVKNNEGLENFAVEIKNLDTKKKTLAVVDSTTGEYITAMKKKDAGHLVITAKAKDHAFTSTVVEVKDVTKDIPAKPVELKMEKAEKGKSFVINNIYYSTGAADLYPQSYLVLDEFVQYMKENPKLTVEIQGHTDNVGNAADNLKLSTERAEAVKKYLVEKGVSTERLTAKGYGSIKPIASNATTEGKAQNRRTEFMIIEM